MFSLPARPPGRPGSIARIEKMGGQSTKKENAYGQSIVSIRLRFHGLALFCLVVPWWVWVGGQQAGRQAGTRRRHTTQAHDTTRAVPTVPSPMDAMLFKQAVVDAPWRQAACFRQHAFRHANTHSDTHACANTLTRHRIAHNGSSR